MDVETFKAISDNLAAEGKDVVATWLHIVGSGHKGIAQDRYVRTRGALQRALRFMLYMSFVSVLFEIPAVALVGVHYENRYYELVSVLEQFVSYLACGICFHLAMRWLGGKASLRDSFVVTCLLTAYSPLLNVFLTPMRKYTFAAMKDMANLGTAAGEIVAAAQRWSRWEWFIFWICWLATSVVIVLFFLGVFRSFRALHRLRLGKAFLSLLIALVMFAVFVAVFLEPFDELVLNAFSHA